MGTPKGRRDASWEAKLRGLSAKLAPRGDLLPDDDGSDDHEQPGDIELVAWRRRPQQCARHPYQPERPRNSGSHGDLQGGPPARARGIRRGTREEAIRTRGHGLSARPSILRATG